MFNLHKCFAKQSVKSPNGMTKGIDRIKADFDLLAKVRVPCRSAFVVCHTRVTDKEVKDKTKHSRFAHFPCKTFHPNSRNIFQRVSRK